MFRLSYFWLADGTFKRAPPFFTQVYVEHAFCGGHQPMRDGYLLPSLFVILPNETEATYSSMWGQIRTLCPLAQPSEMLLHLEKAGINSFEMWPDKLVRCCFFHLTRIYGARCRLLGCKLTTIRTSSWLCASDSCQLVFASLSVVPHVFAAAVHHPSMPQETELLLYFERTYIWRTLPGGTHQAPLFPIYLWNFHIDTLFGLPCTT